MPSVFTRIIDGELPGTFVWRDDVCVAFMSINPTRAGHCLVVPRAEVDQWIDLDPAIRAHCFEIAGLIAEACRTAFGTERVGLVIAGFEVPHTHLHVIPADAMADLDFAHAASSVDPDELGSHAEAIRSALRARGHGTEVG
ncbi:MAG: HIT family protein [Ilumatobacteraceae bacterium]